MIEHRPTTSPSATTMTPDAWGWGRVWNDDEIAPGQGFPPHPHANMDTFNS